MTITNQEVIDEFKDVQGMAQTGGTQAGGGPSAADQDAAGGSSGEGGYGAARIDSLGAGEESGGAHVPGDGLSRGERLDVQANGGRGDDAVDDERDEDAALDPDEPLKQDQQEHQDQGQRWIDEHSGAPDGSERQDRNGGAS